MLMNRFQTGWCNVQSVLATSLAFNTLGALAGDLYHTALSVVIAWGVGVAVNRILGPVEVVFDLGHHSGWLLSGQWML